MKFELDSGILLDGIQTVTRALANKAPSPVLECVKVEAEYDSGAVRLTCYDGSLGITWTARANVIDEGCALIPGKMFGEIMRKLPGGEVVIESNGKSAAIRCQRSRSSLAVVAGEYPEIAEVKKGTEVLLPQVVLKSMIGHTAFAIGTDDARLILTGGLMEIRPDAMFMVGLDGFRLAMQKTEGMCGILAGKDSIRCVIPGKVLGEVSRLLDNSEENCLISIADGRMSFRFGGTTMVCTLLAGDYVDFGKIIPQDFKTEVQVLKKDLMEAIDRANLIAREGKNNLVKMRISGDAMQVSSNAEIGNVLEEMEINHTGDDLDIAFNSKYILEAIKNCDGDTVNMRLNSQTAPCVFVPEEGDEWKYLVLPVRTM